jgi:hypothetical protein
MKHLCGLLAGNTAHALLLPWPVLAEAQAQATVRSD